MGIGSEAYFYPGVSFLVKVEGRILGAFSSVERWHSAAGDLMSRNSLQSAGADSLSRVRVGQFAGLVLCGRCPNTKEKKLNNILAACHPGRLEQAFYIE